MTSLFDNRIVLTQDEEEAQVVNMRILQACAINAKGSCSDYPTIINVLREC